MKMKFPNSGEAPISDYWISMGRLQRWFSRLISSAQTRSPTWRSHLGSRILLVRIISRWNVCMNFSGWILRTFIITLLFSQWYCLIQGLIIIGIRMIKWKAKLNDKLKQIIMLTFIYIYFMQQLRLVDYLLSFIFWKNVGGVYYMVNHMDVHISTRLDIGYFLCL